MTQMSDLWTVNDFARWKYGIPAGLDVPKAKRNAVSRMCLNGTLPAKKVGKEWRINTRRFLEVFDE